MDWLELSRVANQRVMLGLGNQRVCLDKRGLVIGDAEIELSVPPNSDRMSDDGEIGYLSGRLIEGDDL